MAAPADVIFDKMLEEDAEALSRIGAEILASGRGQMELLSTRRSGRG
jgi:hypothetical protein